MYKVVLSIDGGGIRGIISCRILLRLLNELKRISKKDNIYLSEYIDYYAGTSTGSVVVSALNIPSVYNPSIPAYTLRDIQSFYIDNAKTIFSMDFLHRLSRFGGIAKSIYQNKGLRDVLYSYFGNMRLSELMKPCIMTSFDMSSNRNLLFKQHLAKQSNSDDFYVRDVCLASSSAPIFFPSARIRNFNGDDFVCCDGGVYANNPSLYAYADIRENYNDAFASNTLFISVGNGRFRSNRDNKQFETHGGASHWLNAINKVFIDSVTESIDNQMKMIYRESPGLYCRWVPFLPDWIGNKIDATERADIGRYIDAADAFVDMNQKDISKVATLLYNNKKKHKNKSEQQENISMIDSKDNSTNSIKPIKPVWVGRYTDLARYPINVNEFENLIDLINHSVKIYKNLIAVESFDYSTNYTEVGNYSDQIASWIQKRVELKPGDRVALQLPNILSFPAIFFGIIKAGLIPVCCNPLYTARELEFVINDSGAKMLFSLDRNAKVVEEALKDNPIPVVAVAITDLFPKTKKFILNIGLTLKLGFADKWSIGILSLDAILNAPDCGAPKPVTITSDQPAIYQYTGGTTGKIKAAILTHKNLIANIIQISSMFPAKYTRPDIQQIVFSPLPMYHIFSLTVNLLSTFYLGNHNVLVVNPRNLDLVIRTLSKYRYNLMTGVNTLYSALCDHPKIKDVDFSELQLCIAGGMTVTKKVAYKWQDISNTVIVQGYGLTEASPVISCSPNDVKIFDGSIGIPLPLTQIALLDENGAAVPPGEIGELVVKGPQVMEKYLNQPEETAKTLTQGNWLKTGDLARIDDRGFLFIADRLKNMINISGLKVYPNEVEDVLDSNPQIIESAIIGVESEKSEQKIVAFLKTNNNKKLKEEELIAFCKKSLAKYKIPKQFIYVKELPKNPVGKILHRKLKEKYFS